MASHTMLIISYKSNIHCKNNSTPAHHADYSLFVQAHRAGYNLVVRISDHVMFHMNWMTLSLTQVLCIVRHSIDGKI